MGVGKSTAGKKLANKLGWNFIDTDSVFEEKYKLDIDAFFNKYGEVLFRKLEHEVLISTLDLHNYVISTGGGMPCYYNAMTLINNHGLSVHITMSEKAILTRLINSKQKRPLVTNKSHDELIRFVNDKLTEREPFYSQSKLTTNAISLNIQTLIDDIKSII